MSMRRTLSVLAVLASATTAHAQRSDAAREAIPATYKPATRAAAIEILERGWMHAEDSQGARRALARGLSWEGRLDAALAHYDALVRALPEDVELALERLQVMMWMGNTRDAEAGYIALLARDPQNGSAHAGLARIRRWQGRPLAALHAARRAVAVAPRDATARQELALSYAQLGQPDAAHTALDGIAAKDVDTIRAIRRARQPTVAAAAVATTDSFGIDRISPRARASWAASPDVRLHVGGGSTHLRTAAEQLAHGVLAAGVSRPRAHYELAMTAAAYASPRTVMADLGASASVRPYDHIRVSLGGRRRPLLEPAEPLATDEGAFFASASGITMPGAVVGLYVDELRLSGNAAPARGSYAYVDARGLRVGDGNAGYVVASGLGLDLLAIDGHRGPLSLVARIDSFVTGFRETRAEYFSPASFHSELLGGQVAVRGAKIGVTAYGGINVSLGSSATMGWTAGGLLEIGGSDLRLQGRFERRDDLAYTAQRAWLALTGSL